MDTQRPATPWTTREILQFHEDLELTYRDGQGGDFLFGWQSVNPFAKDLLESVRLRCSSVDHTKYSYMEDDDELAHKVIELHKALDGVGPSSAFCAASGGTSILFTFCYWLARLEVKEVYYVPPIYFTLLNGLRTLNIRARAVSGFHSFEADATLNLPEKKTVLIVADPIWYAGIPVPERIMSQISKWQQTTGSLIFVDGSFQYMRWDGEISEPSAGLDPSKTMRLVSPTKSLVVHGYRFAYALMPSAWKPKFSNSYANICGSSSADNTIFAHAAIAELKGARLTRKLIKRAAGRHKRLRAAGAIQSTLTPQTGYFVFEKLNVPVPGQTLHMSGKYFGQPRYPDYTRINLLSTKFHLLSRYRTSTVASSSSTTTL